MGLAVKMRVDRRPTTSVSDAVLKKRIHACRMWVKHPDDDEATIVINNMAVPPGVDLYPCIYASRPDNDIRHAVSLRGQGCMEVKMFEPDPTAGETYSFLNWKDVSTTSTDS